MNLRQTYHFTLNGRRRCSAGWCKWSWWGDGSTQPTWGPKATPIWPKRGYASAPAGNSHTTMRGQHTNAKLVLEGKWGDKVVTPTSKFLVQVVLILMIGGTPSVLALDISISYIEDKITLIIVSSEFLSII